MQSLPLPNTIEEDLKVISRITKNKEWKLYREKWVKAYKDYHSNCGNPFNVSPVGFDRAIAERQYGLYDTRKRSGALARMRKQSGLLSCPVCGSPVTGQLDHYLPRSIYPEFAIMRMNLVPACSHCNSGAKGTTVHGDLFERFIQPYFDTWASEAIWLVRFVRPFEAVTFEPVPIDGLSEEHEMIVRFHLNNVLGDQFHRSLTNEWSTYPLQIAQRRPETGDLNVSKAIGQDLRVAISAKGKNSWQAAFFRGLSVDAEAKEYIRQKCESV